MSEIAIVQRDNIDKERIALWKQSFCKGGTDTEMELFIAVCKRTGLCPESRQIYSVPRWNSNAGREVMTHQVSIDGFRLIAERSGKYGGQTIPEFTDDGVSWTNCWLKNTPPKAARVGVIRNDFKIPVSGIARWDSYVQTQRNGKPTHTWAKMPEVMLAKCAESLALRKAFPQDLSGLYTTEEMAQADNPVKPAMIYINEDDQRNMFNLIDNSKDEFINRNSFRIFLRERYAIEASKDITQDKIGEIYQWINGVGARCIEGKTN